MSRRKGRLTSDDDVVVLSEVVDAQELLQKIAAERAANAAVLELDDLLLRALDVLAVDVDAVKVRERGVRV